MSKLLPYRSHEPSDIVNGLFSLNQTGVDAGTLVSVVSGADPSNDPISQASTSPGASFVHAYSYDWEVPNKITPSASGDSKYKVLGITLFDSFETDENGEKYKFYARKRDENQIITSGKAMPVLRQGLVTLKTGAYSGTPAVGSVGVVSDTGNGVITVKTEAEINSTGTFQHQHVVGKFISAQSSGTTHGSTLDHGGFAWFVLNV